MKVRTDAVHFTADQKLIEYIDQKLEKLEQFYDRIMDANVILKLENSGQIKDKIVEIKLNVPGELLFSRESGKSFETAVDSAADNLRRQLIRYKELQRGW